ncbi:MAG: EamA family transporter [Opitutaceae bacterium]
MFAALFAATFFALSASCAHRSLRHFGPARANLGRLGVATLVLGAFAHTAGGGLGSVSTGWFFLSGVIGMGLGDLAVYAALPRLGSRLTVLLVQCLAAPLAAAGEWLWLGTRISGAEMLWGTVILAGVALALAPGRGGGPVVGRGAALGFAFLAAGGQGFGALVSRKGVQAASAAGEAVANATFGLTAAYQRILAGLLFTALWFAVQGRWGRTAESPWAAYRHPGAEPSSGGGWGWMVANGLAGPVIGVGCYQWALATTPSGLVLPIAATAPLLAMPIAFWLEGDRPGKRAILGGLVAVAGCVALARAR